MPGGEAAPRRLPHDHPPVQSGRIGVVLLNLGTPDGTATLAGIPAAGTGGTYPLTFSATNSVGTTPQSFNLTVLEGPAITSVPATTFTAATPP